MKVVPSQAKRPKTSLRKSSIKKHEITQNCPFLPSLPLPFPRTVIAFHRIKTSLLSFERVRTVPYFLQIAHFDIFYVCVVYLGGDRSGMDKSLSATCLLYSDVTKGDPSPRWLRKYWEEDEDEAVKRAMKESEIFVS